eukprot:scaffold90494_cov63-Phaeocystis_antarctica.AAC.1
MTVASAQPGGTPCPTRRRAGLQGRTATPVSRRPSRRLPSDSGRKLVRLLLSGMRPELHLAHAQEDLAQEDLA